jgi:N-ATPase, AtpR subunit
MDAQGMTSLHLDEHVLLALRVGAWLSTGAVIGALYFLTLRWSVKMLTADKRLLPAMALQLGRLALLAGLLAIIVSSFGALPLLLTTAGIFATRIAVVQRGEQV